jgi:hypothetical protein
LKAESKTISKEMEKQKKVIKRDLSKEKKQVKKEKKMTQNSKIYRIPSTAPKSIFTTKPV